MLKKIGRKGWNKKLHKKNSKYIFGLSLQEAVFTVFCGVIITLSKFVIRIPLQIPGHSGVIWMAIFTFCCMMYKRGFPGTLAGIISGVLAVYLGLGKEGVFVLFKYLTPGITMDILLHIYKFDIKWYTAGIIAAMAHASKLLSSYIIGVLLNLPRSYLLLGLNIAAINHVAFGFVGGVVGFLMYKKWMSMDLNKRIQA